MLRNSLLFVVLAFSLGCGDDDRSSTETQPHELQDTGDESLPEDAGDSVEIPGEEGGEDTAGEGGETASTDAGIELDGVGPETDTQEEVSDASDDDTLTESDVETGEEGGEGAEDKEEIVDCGNPAVSESECDVEPGSDVWVFHGTVIGATQTFIGGEVVIANGEVKCVGCDCGESQGVDGATRITCGEGIISPGLINAHDHITFTQYPPVCHVDGSLPVCNGEERYDHRHEWRKGLNGKTKLSVTQNFYNKGETWGELRLLFSGTTSVLGSGGEPGFLRNLDKPNLLEGLGKPAAEYDTFPLGDASGTLSNSGCGPYNLDFGFDIEKEFAYCPHVAEGINDYALNEFLCLSGLNPGSIDILAPNSAFIHGIGITATEVALMAGEGTGLIWSPRSNISLYGHTASVTLYDLLGAGIALGTDWTASGSMNMLREVQCADYLNQNHYAGYFSDRELIDMASYNGALLLGYGDVLGALEPGFVADITIFRGESADPHRAVLDAGVSDVMLVVRGGTALYGRDSILTALPQFNANGCESIEVCGETQQVCIQQETGETLASLQAGVSGGTFETYPLFFCDTPADEPTCVPSRPGEFSGLASDNDVDGDGIINADDNCPDIFNPFRPVDGEVQTDKDGDGLGDVCDPCPFDADTTACTSVNPDDLDGDGAVNAQDNCVNVPNEDQADTDTDGKGDLCDPCPEYSNPGNLGCLTPIYDVASGKIAENEVVFLEDMVVTAVGGNGFFAQLNPASAGYSGGQFSGIWVYNGGADEQPPVGTQLNINASYQLYFGEPELADPELTVTGEGILIAPEIVNPGDVATAGSLSAAYTGVLIAVKDVVVENVTPDPAGQSTPTNEFAVTGGLLVDDYFYKLAPFPSTGDTISSITGVLKYSWNNTKLAPRSFDDIQLGPPVLDGFSQDMTYIFAGNEGPGLPPLFVLYSSPVEAETFISIESGAPDALMVEGGGVTLGTDEVTGEVILQGITAQEEPVTLTATSGTESVTTLVQVLSPTYLPEVLEIQPSSSAVTPEGVVEIKALFSGPIPPGGAVLEWTAESLGEASLNPPVTGGQIQVDEFSFETAFSITMSSEPTTVLVNVSLDESFATTEIEVTSLLAAGLVLSEVYYDEPGDDAGKEWVKLYNASPDSVDLSGYSLGWGGTSWTYGVLGLEGSVEPWSCVVIGGPGTSTDNGSPTFDFPVNLEPDLQNGGSTADGVALFALQAFEVTTNSLPVDTVLYGGTNQSGLKGSTGAPAEVNTPDVNSGWSLQRIGVDSWDVTENPSPETCPALEPPTETP